MAPTVMLRRRDVLCVRVSEINPGVSFNLCVAGDLQTAVLDCVFRLVVIEGSVVEREEKKDVETLKGFMPASKLVRRGRS